MRAMIRGGLLLAFLGSVAGCDESSCREPGCPDTAACAPGDAREPAEDSTAQDTRAPGDAGAVPGTCLLGRAGCVAGQADVYGICLGGFEVPVAGASFTMGLEGVPWAAPEHEVTVSGFAMDRTEVTNRMWAACVACGVCTPPLRNASYTGREPGYYGNPEYDDFPVVHVTWPMAAAFCEGLGKSLPTEAQWERAAQGPHGAPWPWGDEDPTWELANTAMAYPDTTAAGAFPEGASPDGVLDLCGNVREWTRDTFHADYYSWSPSQDPVAPEEGGYVKTVRGGSFGSWEEDARVPVRQRLGREGHYAHVGFRCVREGVR